MITRSGNPLELIHSGQAAKMLGVPKWVILEIVAEGRVRFRRVDGEPWFERGEIDRLGERMGLADELD